MTGKPVKVNILEIKRPELDAKLVAQSIAEQLQNRVAFRRAMKRALTSRDALRRQGRARSRSPAASAAPRWRAPRATPTAACRCTRCAPTSTTASSRRSTTFGRIGVKCWINKGEVMPEGFTGVDLTDLEGPSQPAGPRRRSPAAARDDRGGRGVAAAVAAAAARAAGRGGGRRPGGPAAAAAAAAASAAVAAAAVAARWPAGRWPLMLAPKRVKHRKQHARPQPRLLQGRQTTVQFGEYGLKALERGWITNRQIEAARIAMTRKIKRGGKVWINVFPDKPFTKKPAETRMGSGKGNPEGWVAVVKPGRVMFELAGVPEDLAREAMRLAGHKLPVQDQVRDARGASADEGRQGTARPQRRRAGRAHQRRPARSSSACASSTRPASWRTPPGCAAAKRDARRAADRRRASAASTSRRN